MLDTAEKLFYALRNAIPAERVPPDLNAEYEKVRQGQLPQNISDWTIYQRRLMDLALFRAKNEEGKIVSYEDGIPFDIQPYLVSSERSRIIRQASSSVTATVGPIAIYSQTAAETRKAFSGVAFIDIYQIEIWAKPYFLAHEALHTVRSWLNFLKGFNLIDSSLENIDDETRIVRKFVTVEVR